MSGSNGRTPQELDARLTRQETDLARLAAAVEAQSQAIAEMASELRQVRRRVDAIGGVLARYFGRRAL